MPSWRFFGQAVKISYVGHFASRLKKKETAILSQFFSRWKFQSSKKSQIHFLIFLSATHFFCNCLKLGDLFYEYQLFALKLLLVNIVKQSEQSLGL